MKFRIWCDEYHTGPEAGSVMEASNPCVAVEKWAERREQRNAEYWIASGNAVLVHVKYEDGPYRGQYLGEYEVIGEAVPHYSAAWKSGGDGQSKEGEG